jgi:hypothetical protein
MLRSSLDYILELYDSCIAANMTTSSPLVILSWKQHFFRSIVIDIASSHLASHASLSPDQLFSIALEVFHEAGLIPHVP